MNDLRRRTLGRLLLVGVWAAVLLMLLPSGASPHAALSSSPPGEPTEVVGTREVASSLASVGTTWTQLCPSCGPSPRGDSAETYDPALGYTLLFGGGDASSVRLGDTWKFENGNWTLLHPVTSPTARQGAEMVYDPTDHEVVLFGGLDNSRNVLNDTWVFVGGNWTALSTPHAPAPRYDTAMVWDASDGYVLLFGGCQVGCASTFGDTWKFLGGGWTQLTPTTSPSTRGWVPMTFDTADGDVVIFGGCAPSYVSLADTWTYHAGLWTQIYPSARPAARCGGLNMVFDASLGYAMMFGGSDNGTILLDTWSWASGAWTQLSPAVSPAGGPLLADDPAQAGVMGFGGTIGCNNCVDNNTWLYHDTVPTPLGISSFSASSSGVALGQSVTFSVVAKGGTPPYTFAYAGLPKGCSSANTALLSCAPAAPGTSTTRVYVNDTASGTVSATTTLDVYAPIFRNWTEICATCGPLPRGDDPIAYDPIDGYTLLFAGGTSVSNLYNDTWMFRNGLWNQLHPSRAPVPMQGPDLVWDPVDHEFVLFGGLDTGRVTHNETWVFSPTTLDWTELSTPHAPVPRYDGSMVWDTSDGYALLFGGCLVTCKPTLGDTWTFVGGTWTELSPATAPSSRGWAPMSYDSADNEVVLFGGAAPNYVPLGDTWTFHAGSWTQIFPALSPSPRFNGIQGFNDDPAVGYAVMYGGGNDTTSFPQTWAFRGGSWTPFTTAVSPGLNGDMGSVYDASAGGMIIFGGGSPIDNATWIFGPWVAPLGIQQFVASPAVIPLGGSTTLTVQAVGGTAPYHYAYSGLPAGCTSTNVASLPCSPSAVGTYSVDVWVNDSASGKVSSTTSFTVYQPIFHNWTEICAACGPSPRGDAPLAYDPVDGYTLLFGGGSGPSYGPRLNDTWMVHNGVWTQLHPAHTPVGLQGADLVWDPTDHEFVLFGGLDGNRITHNETWAFSPVTQDWTELSTPHAPATRYDGSMVWDAADGYVLLFGGCYVTCKSVLGDTWKFLGGTWTELTPASVPSARGWAPLTYDSADSEVVLFGGAAPNYAALGDTWLFKGGTWTEIFPSTSPAARWNGLQGFSDDPALGYAVMYGGTTGAVSLSDSWAFKAGTWTQVTTATNAGTNGDMGMTYDASAGGVIMFGNGQPGTIDNSTWIYGPWSPPPLSVSLTAAPSPTDSGSPVDLTATSSGGAGSISYAFAFGDGSLASGMGPKVNHTYARAGTYVATVWANDSVSQSASAQASVVILPPMVVSLQASPNPAVLGSPVAFTSTVSGGLGPYTYAWNFGDGGLGGNLANITHIFATNGPFTVVLSVRDANGITAYGSLQISILLQVDMSANVTLGATPLVTAFTSSVTGGVGPYAYAWVFGDGGTSNVASPTHTYTVAGSYSAKLTVTDAADHTAVRTWNLTAFSGGGPLQVALNANPSQFYLGNSTLISAAITGGHGGYVVSWSTLPTWCSASGLTSLSCKPTVTGSYTFELTVTDAAGSTQTGSVTIHVLGPNQKTTSPTGPFGLPATLGWTVVVLLVVAALAIILAVTYEARRRSRRVPPPPAPISGVGAWAPPSPAGPTAPGERKPIPPSGEGDHLRDLF